MTRILFLCVENAGRSQMAEGFAKKFAPPGVEIHSAGSRPAAELHPAAVEAMRERGIDISAQRPKGIETLPDGIFDLVIGMGCADACPVHRAKRVLTWDIPNPQGESAEAVRLIRDQIENHVRKLLREISG